jgi:hypothetical protein
MTLKAGDQVILRESRQQGTLLDDVSPGDATVRVRLSCGALAWLLAKDVEVVK